MLNLRVGCECQVVFCNKDDFRSSERRASVVQRYVAGFDSHRRSACALFASAADEQALRPELAELRCTQSQRAHSAASTRTADQNIHRAADIHRAASSVFRALRDDRALQIHRRGCLQHELSGILRQTRNARLVGERASEQEGVRLEFVVLRADTNDVGRRDFKTCDHRLDDSL